MFKKILAAAVVTVAAFALTVAGTAPAGAAAPELQIIRVGYNAAGPDTLANRWQEYIDLKNVSGSALNVKGWSTQDAWAHSKNGNNPQPGDCNTAVFSKEHFPWLDTDADDDGTEDGLWLPAGHIIRVYTGGAADNSNNAQHSMAINKDGCGYNGHYLNNGKDTVYVKRANGTLVTKFAYDFSNGYWTG